MTFWIVAAVVVAVLFALAWWSSGRQRRGVDALAARRSREISEGDAAMKAGRPTGTTFNPGAGNGGAF